MPEEPTQVQNTPTVTSHGLSKTAKILIGVSVLAVILLTGLAWWKVTDSAKEDNPPVTKDETADWVTYTNDRFKFQIKYPKNWLKVECEQSGPGGAIVGVNLSFAPESTLVGSCESVGIVSFSYLEAGYMQILDEEQFNNFKREKVTVGGIEATKTSGQYKETSTGSSNNVEKDGTRIQYLSDHNGYTLLLDYYSDPSSGDYSREFELLASTFKFL